MHGLQAMCYIAAMNKAAPLLFLLAGCGVSAPPPEKPAHAVQVLSVACSMVVNRPRADVAIRNVGPTTIEWPSGMVSFGGVRHDGAFRPYPLRPGGDASMTVFGNAGESLPCSLDSVTDGDGFSAALQR